MKAWVIRKRGEIGDIEYIDLPEPAVGPGEVVVRVKAAAVNPADLKVISGKKGGKFLHSGKSPIRLGYDFSGIVEKRGENVPAFHPGDEVFGFLPYTTSTREGSFAQSVAVRTETIARKPTMLGHVAAASAATVASTALQSLVGFGGIQRGQSVLINGASGGVGSFAVQIARSMGATVWGTCSVSNIDYVRSLGAQHVLDYRETNLGRLFDKFDIVFDAAATTSFAACAGIMKPKGVYITLLPSPSLIGGMLRTLLSARKCAVCIVKPRTSTLQAVAQMFEEGKLNAPIAATFPIHDLPKALETLRAGGVKGKIGLIAEDQVFSR
ncbi:MAG: NAD(P)-dependent alcohol dehydrogenase [Opitutaceae bacterium]